MNVIVNDSALLLEPAQTIELLDAAGATAAVERGCVWITMDGDRRDIVLKPGDQWQIERNGRTLVHAHTSTKVRLIGPRTGASHPLLQRAMKAAKRAVAGWLGLPRWAPYY